MNFEVTLASFLLILSPAFVVSHPYALLYGDKIVAYCSYCNKHASFTFIMILFIIIMQWKIVIITTSVLFSANRITQLIS